MPSPVANGKAIQCLIVGVIIIWFLRLRPTSEDVITWPLPPPVKNENFIQNSVLLLNEELKLAKETKALGWKVKSLSVLREKIITLEEDIKWQASVLQARLELEELKDLSSKQLQKSFEYFQLAKSYMEAGSKLETVFSRWMQLIHQIINDPNWKENFSLSESESVWEHFYSTFMDFLQKFTMNPIEDDELESELVELFNDQIELLQKIKIDQREETLSKKSPKFDEMISNASQTGAIIAIHNDERSDETGGFGKIKHPFLLCFCCALVLTYVLSIYFLLQLTKPEENIAETVARELQRNSDPQALFHACFHGHQNAVRQILARNDTVDILKIEPISGHTAFHLAASLGHLSIVQQLMNHFGSSVCNNLVNADGKSGLEIAAENGRQDVVQAILKTIKRRKMKYAKWQEVMKSAFKSSIGSNSFEAAKMIKDKMEDDNISFVTDPNFDFYFVRFYEISKQLAERKAIKRVKKKQKDRDIYKDLIFNVLRKDKKETSANSNQSLEEDFECPVCFELMCSPLRIYSCHNDHLLCSGCLVRLTTWNCPLCRDDFSVRKPRRAIEAEEEVKQFKK